MTLVTPPPPATWGERLRDERRRRVVGRDREISAVLDALTSGEVAAVHVHGPGGVGKSAFLDAVMTEFGHHGRPFVRVDCSHIEASPRALEAGLRTAVGAGDHQSLVELVPPGTVVVIDRLEVVGTSEGWLWHSLVPAMPAGTALVTASRRPPPASWVDDAVWRDVSVTVPLRNVGAADAAHLLEARGVPAHEVPGLVSATHGHPLALVIAADAWHLRPEGPAPSGRGGVLVDHPDVAARLLGRLVDDVVDPLQRRALHVCGHARRVDRAMLRDVLEVTDADADALLDWLRERPYAETHPDGLSVHDLVRDALDRDLRWRDRDAFADLHHRVREVIRTRLVDRPAAEAETAAQELLFLHRGNPMAAGLYDFDRLGSLVAVPVGTAEDRTAWSEILVEVEGPIRANAATTWLDDSRTVARLVVENGRRVGAVCFARLDGADATRLADDPVAVWTMAALARHRPVEPGEAVLHQFIADGVSPDALGGFSDVVAALSLRVWTVPALGWCVVSSTRAPVWAPLWAYIGFEPLGEIDLDDGRTVGVWARDFRNSPYSEWLDELGQREIDDTGTAPPPVASTVALAREDFDRAVRQLLRELHKPDRMLSNPLMGSRLAGDAAGDAPRALREAVQWAVDQVAADPATVSPSRAVDRTYLRPATTQERAAEVLGLPFSTYRRHLVTGVDRVVELLWSREINGGRPPG